ncbi:hypothetical protein [Nitrolancea hollandica]|uniref:Uncharacterized protein n=1 Tax=Nitrolancea hollandica Lb TaxID=1129897 RepID=I4EKH5_9BACT|nr:hypothetical protein [Nitrolancea hollandica]CCF85187.1 hypothetical protein NITHO_460023 [Nitrolancea hollandica Lb]
MQEKLEAIINKLASPTGGVAADEWGDKRNAISIWAHLMGREGDSVIIRLGESLLRVKADSIEDVQEVPASAASKEEGIEVFLRINETSEVVTSVKQIGKVVQWGHRKGGEVPFALGRPPAPTMVELTDKELLHQQRSFEAWQQKLGLFEKFRIIVPPPNPCTTRNTTVWTLDPGGAIINDGSEGDFCESY